MMKTDIAHDTFTDPVKRSAWVLYQLRLQGQSLASLARDVGVDRTAPYQALRRPYPKMERAIADAVGMPVHELFPDRYDAKTGERLIRRGRKPGKSSHHVNNHNNDSRNGSGRNRQNGEAA